MKWALGQAADLQRLPGRPHRASCLLSHISIERLLASEQETLDDAPMKSQPIRDIRKVSPNLVIRD